MELSVLVLALIRIMSALIIGMLAMLILWLCCIIIPARRRPIFRNSEKAYAEIRMR